MSLHIMTILTQMINLIEFCLDHFSAVQARELTTLQSILQNQVERNGRHFFKEGSMVMPGQISTTNKYYAVKLQATFSGNAISTYLSSYVGKIITGSISGITARVIAVTCKLQLMHQLFM